MSACPSCGAPLDPEGVCSACGALSRGLFRDLDLGPPQLAQAVARGLDFYRLLGADPAADTRQLARRYRQLRVLFPDDSSTLAPEPSRRLTLLEVAGRTLTDPALRQVYDELRATAGAQLQMAVRRCRGCTAPLEPGAERCPYCATPVPAEPDAPSAPLAEGSPAAEPVDYYALIGLTPVHLAGELATRQSDRSVRRRGVFSGASLGEPSRAALAGPPTPHEVDAAACGREREVLLAPGPVDEGREARAAEIELARRILRTERWRARYDLLWRAFQQGAMNAGHLEALRALQDEARAEIAAEHGEPQPPGDGAALLRQGLGLLQAGLAREALAPLRAAVTALPGNAQVHAAYVRAILSSADPLDQGAHLLRQALASIEAAARLQAPLESGEALAALCRGLLARDKGDICAAEDELRRAARLDGSLAPVWRALAALALGRGAYEEALTACRRALAVNRGDERALLMAAAACLRSRRRAEAREAAAQVAVLRGGEWTPEAVLREIG
jgi:tetratricopeptide (TPR) repeat protein